MSRTFRVSTAARLLALIKPYTAIFVIAMFALAIGSAINLLFPEIIRRILNDPNFKIHLEHPWYIASVLVSLFAIQAICFYIRIYYFSIIGLRVVRSLRVRLFESLISQEIAVFDANRSGDFVSRISADTALMQDAVSVKLSVILRYSLQVIVGIFLMAYMSFTLTCAIIATLLVLVALSMVLGKRLKFYSKIQQVELGKATVLAEESFSAIRLVKAFSIEKFLSGIFARANDEVVLAGAKRSVISAFFQSFVNFLMNGSLVIILLYGIYLAAHKQLSYGDLTSFLLYGVIVAVSFSFAVACYGELLQALGGAERVFEYLDKAATSEGNDGVHIKNVTGAIKFQNVSFAYPARAEITALSRINCSFPAGKTTALIGNSGAGKSTLISLFLKFYAPSSGKILLDGIDIQTISTLSLRENIALVPQDARLFGLTIRENLSFVRETVSELALVDACKKARIYDFIQSLPLGFDTPLGDSALQISGGQRQRLAIARAILKDPRILILDEATSSLDSENEALVQEALQQLMQGRTTIIIAHRLSTTKSADHILVLDQGHILEEGDPSSLLSRNGPYREYVRLQELKVAS